MAEDLRHFLQTEAAAGPALPPSRSPRPPGSTQEATPARRPGRSDSDRPGRQDRPQGTAVVRPARRRLLPRAAARPPRPRRPAREPPVLEDPDRVDRPRHHLPGRPDLRPVGLRQVVAGQGGVAAPAGQATCWRSTSRRRRRRPRPGCSRACARPAPSCPPGWAWSMRWPRCGGGGSLRPGQKVLLVLDQFEQWLLRPAGRGEHRAGRRPAAVRRRARPGDRAWSATTSGWRRPGSCATWRSDLARRREHRRRRSLRPAARPQGPDGLRPRLRGLARAAIETRDPGPGGVPRPGGRGAGPGRQGHLGAAGAVRRDGQGEALDPGDAAGGRRHARASA